MHPTLKQTVLLACLSLGLLFSKAMAGDEDMMKMLQGMNINKAQIESALQQLESQGIIKKDEAEKARAQLGKMSDSYINNLKNVAAEKVGKGDIPKEAQAVHLDDRKDSKEEPPERRPSQFDINDYK
ncbi:MAG: hypothetical protein COW00_09600 [Bdellovibrio sp. CG12_big_fil_rev_8_21_14_0_65_39_13]|nr:MAG: hypothetical protein COW78_16135 [Bdellovibrio sp. CG22_combo_CG10-13_8_21_14_all_39_27]PIQ59633.1 MAG: hypothetical protein COW00_09600 [Bdellovibrio sp. CG12_big_fil_rev_8_21_14_0_65_39_13]